MLQAKRSGGNRVQLYAQVIANRDGSAGRETGEDSRVLSTIYNLAATVDARDHYTCSHSKKVNEYAVALAEELQLKPLEISRLSTCAFLHDIGKIGISDEILNKPGKLNEDEWRVVKHHTQMGAAIASHAGQLAPCINGILYHHERFDGNGYPSGLKGDEIPLEARILAIADAFAAMLSERRYSAPLTREQALEELKRCAGKQFDPKLVEVFLCIMNKETVVTVNENGGR
jgi:putative nucleotidyltransferase with HDIG domain